MDDFDYSVHISERDWDSFFQECEECDLLPPVLAGLDDSGMSDIDDLNSHLSGHRPVRHGRDIAGPDQDPIDGPPHCEGSPVEMYLNRYGLRSPDYVLSGSEDDLHLESVNLFFEQLRSVTTAEQSHRKHPTAKVNIKSTQENLCANRVDIDDEYPPISHLHKAPLKVKQNQDAFGSDDVKPKNKTDSGHLAKYTGVQSKAATDWYTRSMELDIREEECPVNTQKSHVWKEYDRRETSHNNLAKEMRMQPVQQLGSSDTGAAALGSNLAARKNGTEVMRGVDTCSQPMLRKNSEPRDPLPGQGQSPSSLTLRRKKRRKKRMSIEPVDPGHSYEGQFQGNLSESDEDRHVRKAEMDGEACLFDFGTVKMADKGSDHKRLSLHPVIDSFSDHLPGQANLHTWRDSIAEPREIFASENQDGGIGLPKAPQGACPSQTLKKMELSHKSIDIPNGRCYEKPLSSAQFLVENSCKSAGTPMSANVKYQMKTPMLPFNNSVATQEENEGDKVTSHLQQITTQPFQVQKSDQVPVPYAPLNTVGSSTQNGLKTLHGPVETQRKTDLALSLSGALGVKEGHKHLPATLAKCVTLPPDSGKTLLMDYSAQIVNSQNGIGPKHTNKMDNLKKLQDALSGFGSNGIQVGPTFDRQISSDVPEASTKDAAADESQSNKNANALKCLQLQNITHTPKNKDSPANSDTVSETCSLDVQIEQTQTLLADNNKPCALPAHLNDPTTATCPPGVGKTTSDKQMQIKNESAEQPDYISDNTQSKQIITYPAKTDPKDPVSQTDLLSEEPSTEEHCLPQIYSDKTSERSFQQLAKTDSNIRPDDESLCDLSKASGIDGNVVIFSSTLNKVDSDKHSEMGIVTKPVAECNDSGNSEIQRSLATINAVVKESCKSVSVQSAPSREVSRPDTEKEQSAWPAPAPAEESDAVTLEKKNAEVVAYDSPPGFTMSSFWNEMEKLTINDILRLRMVSHAQQPSILTSPDASFAETSHARDSGYFTHVDDSRPDRSCGDMSTMSDFDEESSPIQDQEVPIQGGDETTLNPSNVLWVNDPDSVLASAEADDVVVLSTDTAIPQSHFAEQQYFRKMCKTISMQNLRALENQPLRQILRNASVQSLRSLDDNSSDPFYHIDPSAHFSDDESVDGRGFSLSEVIEFLFCDDDTKSTVSETENHNLSHQYGTSVAENYDHFFSEFETANLFFSKSEGSAGSSSGEMLPIFSCSRPANRNLHFPEMCDYFFPDSPTQSDGEDEHEHSPPIRVVSRYDQKWAALPNSATAVGDSKSTFSWTSPLSLRRVRRTGLSFPSSQSHSWSLVPANSNKRASRRTIQPINVMGYEDQGSFPDPLLCDLESRIFRKLAEQQMRCPELQTAVADPRIDAPLVPLRQADMCLVCIAFASWVMKSASPQGADTWKAVLLANISALSAIRYLRRYVREEAVGAKELHQIQA